MWWKVFSAVLAAGLLMLAITFAVNSSMDKKAAYWDDMAGIKIEGLKATRELLSLGANTVGQRDKWITDAKAGIADARAWLKTAPSHARRQVELSQAIEATESATVYVALR